MINKLVKKLYIKRFGDIYDDAYVNNLLKTIKKYESDIESLKKEHKSEMDKVSNTFKDTIHILEDKIEKINKVKGQQIDEKNIVVIDNVEKQKTKRKPRKTSTSAK